jgi:hypothetical protein
MNAPILPYRSRRGITKNLSILVSLMVEIWTLPEELEDSMSLAKALLRRISSLVDDCD